MIKNLLISLAFTILYYAFGLLVYFLLALLFTWMFNWWWLFIILIGIFQLPAGIIFFQQYSLFSLVLSKNIISRILTILISIRFLYFTINWIWNIETDITDAKVITVKIIATIMFSFIYVPGVILPIVYREYD